MARTGTQDPTTPEPDQADVMELREGESNPFVNSLLHAARALQDQKDALTAKIAANRENLRSLKTQGYMDAEQGKAVDEFYPVRTRKPKDGNGGDPAATS